MDYLPVMIDISHGAHIPAGRQASAIVVSGAGVVGLALGIALARAGFTVTVLGPVGAARNGRTVALLDGSVRMLAALGVWPRVAGRAAPLAVMRIVDATGSLFRGPPVDFRADEIGLPAFGYNIENAALVEALESAAATTAGLVRVDGFFAGSRVVAQGRDVESTAGALFHTTLLVAADGAASPARAAAGIATRDTTYPQVALTMLLDHTAPHGDVSTEFHTREGPFTLVPMRATATAPHRSSLVWVMAPAEAERRLALAPAALADEVEAQGGALIGHVAIEGRIGRFPIRRMTAKALVGERIALVGEAAHALPPIGAQGLNLSLRDAATLVDLLRQARTRGLDPGSAAVLGGYQRERAGDVALRGAGVDALNRSLLSPLPPIDALRGLGLSLLARMPAARRALMRQGLMPQHAIPSLMR
jgi:2-octaprenyl-6-methoxyphenol hydroxylase